MKYEGGPHRVQRYRYRNPGRVHTSSATVSVLPEADEIDIRIEESDLQVDVFRSSKRAPVNTTDSAVRITHKPTGIIVSMQDEKSQLQNKARRWLFSGQGQAEQERTCRAISFPQGPNGWRGRSEKIRTYNFKENRATDHRIGLTLYKLSAYSGDINQVTDALAENERASQLTTLKMMSNSPKIKHGHDTKNTWGVAQSSVSALETKNFPNARVEAHWIQKLHLDMGERN